MDDHFLPDGTTVFVLEKVNFVEHHECKVLECRRAGVDHVPQDLGCHHENRCIGVDAGVAGQESNLAVSEQLLEITELLVRQGLERGRVKRPASRIPRAADGVLGDERLARTGRSRDENRRTLIEGGARRDLEWIRCERHVAARDRRWRRHAIRKPMPTESA